jgi:hypothetical protein
MSDLEKIKTTGAGGMLDLLRGRGTEWEGGIEFGLAVREALRKDLRALDGLSRDQVADQLSQWAGRKITRAQLDALVADTHQHRFPAELVPVWVRVTGSARILVLICEAAGYWVANETERDLARMAWEQIRREKSAGVVEKLKAKLWDMVT